MNRPKLRVQCKLDLCEPTKTACASLSDVTFTTAYRLITSNPLDSSKMSAHYPDVTKIFVQQMKNMQTYSLTNYKSSVNS